MIETHPFLSFTPPNTRCLILGSFTGKEAVPGQPYSIESYDWFYGTRSNQFWPILEKVYGVELKSKDQKQALFTRLGIAIADIIYQCERKAGSNLDANLEIIAYNQAPIEEILDSYPIERIYFTSRFVERKFKRAFKEVLFHHPGIQGTALPSPSRRYARMGLEEKTAKYKELLPKNPAAT